MKGDLALDTTVSWLILLVMAVVVIGIIFNYGSAAGGMMEIEDKNQPEAQYFEYDVVSESQMETFIQSCWAKTGEDFNKDGFICFVIKGDMSSISAKNLEGEFDGYEVVMDEFDNSKTIATVMFEDVGNKVIVRN